MADCNILLVIFVVFLITYIPVSAQLLVLQFYFPFGASWKHSLFYVVFDGSVLMLWFNYYKAVTMDPGRVPLDWDPSKQTDGFVELKQSTTAPRFCRTCQVNKPPRAHHCSSCNRCVLKMDHHCPWINNCVGHRNQPYFLRFLFYVNVATSLCVGALGYQMYDWVTSPYPAWYYSDAVFYQIVGTVLDLIMGVPVLLMVGGLSAYHFYYVATNCTTIESMEKERKALVQRHDGLIGSVHNPYKLGVWANITSVFGPNPLLWLLPVDSARGDGLAFPINETARWEYLQHPPAVPQLPKFAHPGGHVRRGSEGYEVDMDALNPYAGYYAQQQQFAQQQAAATAGMMNLGHGADPHAMPTHGAAAGPQYGGAHAMHAPPVYPGYGGGGAPLAPGAAEEVDELDDHVPLIHAKERLLAKRDKKKD
ncbi:Palmitoyltransferase [Blastocladiella emersonii ATCC 22665]|nr:Palmitoyltransferase [Blastocladiella emersonii ATCC 22665]